MRSTLEHNYMPTSTKGRADHVLFRSQTKRIVCYLESCKTVLIFHRIPQSVVVDFSSFVSEIRTRETNNETLR